MPLVSFLRWRESFCSTKSPWCAAFLQTIQLTCCYNLKKDNVNSLDICHQEDLVITWMARGLGDNNPPVLQSETVTGMNDTIWVSAIRQICTSPWRHHTSPWPELLLSSLRPRKNIKYTHPTTVTSTSASCSTSPLNSRSVCYQSYYDRCWQKMPHWSSGYAYNHTYLKLWQKYLQTLS